MSDRTELPSAQQLRELRSKGKAPYSQCAAAATATLFVVGMFVLDTSLWAGFSGILRAQTPLPEKISAYSDWLALVVARSALAAFVGWFIARVAQTRIFWNSTLFSPRMDRLWQWGRADSALGRGRFGRAIFSVFIGSILAVAVTWVCYRDLAAAFMQEVTALSAVGAVLQRCVGVGLTIVVIVGCLSFAVEQIRFRRQHRQTRAQARQDEY